MVSVHFDPPLLNNVGNFVGFVSHKSCVIPRWMRSTFVLSPTMAATYRRRRWLHNGEKEGDIAERRREGGRRPLAPSASGGLATDRIFHQPPLRSLLPDPAPFVSDCSFMYAFIRHFPCSGSRLPGSSLQKGDDFTVPRQRLSLFRRTVFQTSW